MRTDNIIVTYFHRFILLKMFVFIFLFFYLHSYGQDNWDENFRAVSSQVFENGKITLLKRIDKGNFRQNPDRTMFYKTSFAVELEFTNQTVTSNIESDAYTVETKDFMGMIPCMLIDAERGVISIFSNSKTNSNDYGMDGFVYRMDMRTKEWKKEIVFTNENWGWFPFFGGSDNGNPELWHFSSAGYYAMLSKRNTSGSWNNQNMGYIHIEKAAEEYSSHQNILIASSSGVDRMGTGATSNSSPPAQGTTIDDQAAAALAVIGSAVILYSLWELFAGTSSYSSRYSPYDYSSRRSTNIRISRINQRRSGNWEDDSRIFSSQDRRYIVFEDGTRGTIYRFKSGARCRRCYWIGGLGWSDYFYNERDAIDALYVYKKYDSDTYREWIRR